MTDFPLLRAAALDNDTALSEQIGSGVDEVAITHGFQPENFAVLYRKDGRWFHWNDACREQPLDTVGDVREHLTAPSDCPEARTPAVVPEQLRDECGVRERRPDPRGRVSRRARGRGRRES